MRVGMRAERSSPTRQVVPADLGHGFTLLEVIIAMSLVSILMVLVWSLFSTYTRLETRSSRAAVELQLVRSISRQLTSDLEHFAVLPTPPNVVLEPGSAESEGDGTTSDDSEDESASDAEQSSGADENDNLSSDSLSNDSLSSDTAASDSLSSDNFANPDPLSDTGVAGSSMDGGVGGSLLGVESLGPSLGPTSNIGVTGPLNGQAGLATSSLPAVTFLRGSATRLEFVTRLPYTVDVPTGLEIIGAETKYGTHQLVLYEWRGEKNLESLLQNDPVLNPSKWNPPPAATTPTASPLGASNAAAPANAPLNVPAPPLPTRLNPNDNVGLIRETKSWLHATRDRQRNLMLRQAANAGLLVDGALTTGAQAMMDEMSGLSQGGLLDESSAARGSSMADDLMSWHPPPELRHRKDHLPEVTRLQFRYFDGEVWALSWNSNDRRPLAIEIAFDLDPNAPAAREKEYLAAHEAMLGGKSISEVLPEDQLDEDELTDELDPLAALNLEDPTQIVTEYRFVILLPKGADRDDAADDARSAQRLGDAERGSSAVEGSVETFGADSFGPESFGSDSAGEASR